MDRRTKLLQGLNLAELLGVEIGAMYRPILSREDGRVLYVDYFNTEQLKERYRSDPNVTVDTIVDVDIATGPASLADCYHPNELADFIVASHVIEHVPDLVSWLQSLRKVLKPDGQVRLAVPDKRFTFDHLRETTRLGDVVSAWLYQAKVPQPQQVVDHLYNAVKVDAQDVWAGRVQADDLERHHERGTVLEHARDAMSNGAYVEVHCWVFTAQSLAMLFEQMADLGLVGFACGGWVDTEHGDGEFFVTLKACDDQAEMLASWRAMRQTLASPSAAAVLGRDLPPPAPPQPAANPGRWARLRQAWSGEPH